MLTSFLALKIMFFFSLLLFLIFHMGQNFNKERKCEYRKNDWVYFQISPIPRILKSIKPNFIQIKVQPHLEIQSIRINHSVSIQKSKKTKINLWYFVMNLKIQLCVPSSQFLPTKINDNMFFKMTYLSRCFLFKKLVLWTCFNFLFLKT